MKPQLRQLVAIGSTLAIVALVVSLLGAPGAGFAPAAQVRETEPLNISAATAEPSPNPNYEYDDAPVWVESLPHQWPYLEYDSTDLVRYHMQVLPNTFVMPGRGGWVSEPGEDGHYQFRRDYTEFTLREAFELNGFTLNRLDNIQLTVYPGGEIMLTDPAYFAQVWDILSLLAVTDYGADTAPVNDYATIWVNFQFTGPNWLVGIASYGRVNVLGHGPFVWAPGSSDDVFLALLSQLGALHPYDVRQMH